MNPSRQTEGMTASDVERGLELDEAEERGRRQGYRQGVQDTVEAALEASLTDRVRGGERLAKRMVSGAKDRFDARRRALPPGHAD